MILLSFQIFVAGAKATKPRAADGWVATECNPRYGAGLGYVDHVLPELTLMMLHYAVVEGVADVETAALECAVVDAGTRTRWGGAWTPVTRTFDETSKVVDDPWRLARTTFG